MYDKLIDDFVFKYKSDAEFKETKEDLYDYDPAKLNMYEIFALEERLDYGLNAMYQSYQDFWGVNYDYDKLMRSIDEFAVLYYRDEIFRERKQKQYLEDSEHMSEFERLIMERIIKFNNSQEEELFYDDYFKINVTNEYEIKKTLLNFLMGRMILEFVNFPILGMMQIKSRMNGNKLASVDKPKIIEMLAYNLQRSMKDVNAYVNFEYLSFLPNINTGLKYFDKFEQYQTNVTVDEIQNYANKWAKER